MKTTKRENKSGTVRYLHLAHNEWDPVKGRAVPKVLFTFGREDDLDRDAVKRLVASLSRLLEPGDALASTAAGDLEFVASVPFGGAYVLDHLWRRLRIDKIVGRVGQPKRGRRRDMSVTERVLFSLVANRALAPSSKLAAADWTTHDVHIDGLAGLRRRLLLPGDGLAARGARGPGEAGVRRGRQPPEPGGRPAVLRHHQHLLRAGGSRRARRPGRQGPPPDRGSGARGRRRRAGGCGRVPHLRQVQGLTRRSPADPDRDGRHEGGDPGPRAGPGPATPPTRS